MPHANFFRFTAASGAVSLSIFSVNAFSADSGCKALLDSMTRQLQIPYHSHTTMTLIPGQPPRLSEQINTGKLLYIMTDGKWKLSKITPQDMRDQRADNIKNSNTSCSVVHDEPIDGVSATLYKVHEERDGESTDSQVWIAKANGLPVRVKSENPPFDSHYSYSDVAVPDVH